MEDMDRQCRRPCKEDMDMDRPCESGQGGGHGRAMRALRKRPGAGDAVLSRPHVPPNETLRSGLALSACRRYDTYVHHMCVRPLKKEAFPWPFRVPKSLT